MALCVSRSEKVSRRLTAISQTRSASSRVIDGTAYNRGQNANRTAIRPCPVEGLGRSVDGRPVLRHRHRHRRPYRDRCEGRSRGRYAALHGDRWRKYLSRTFRHCQRDRPRDGRLYGDAGDRDERPRDAGRARKERVAEPGPVGDPHEQCLRALYPAPGHPIFTTDTAAALRAAEMNCDAMLKGTQVDGVYSADPKLVPDAERYEFL